MRWLKIHSLSCLSKTCCFVLLLCNALGLAMVSAPTAAAQESHAARAGGEYFSPHVYGKASLRVYHPGQSVPPGGGYRVAGRVGKTKVMRDYSAGETQIGNASWYGKAFHGRKTANGEIYDLSAISAAHPSFPLPSYARVINLSNGHSIIVRVNDRGPYVGNRVMDLSRSAAQALGMVRAGIGDVMITYLGKAELAGESGKTLLATLWTDGTPAEFPPVLMAQRELLSTHRMQTHISDLRAVLTASLALTAIHVLAFLDLNPNEDTQPGPDAERYFADFVPHVSDAG